MLRSDAATTRLAHAGEQARCRVQTWARNCQNLTDTLPDCYTVHGSPARIASYRFTHDMRSIEFASALSRLSDPDPLLMQIIRHAPSTESKFLYDVADLWYSVTGTTVSWFSYVEGWYIVPSVQTVEACRCRRVDQLPLRHCSDDVNA